MLAAHRGQHECVPNAGTKVATTVRRAGRQDADACYHVHHQGSSEDQPQLVQPCYKRLRRLRYLISDGVEDEGEVCGVRTRYTLRAEAIK